MFYVLFFIFIAGIVALFTVPQLQGYRTKIVGAFLTIVGGLVPLLSDVFTQLQQVDWQQILSQKEAAIALAVIGVLVIVFRHFAGTGK